MKKTIIAAGVVASMAIAAVAVAQPGPRGPGGEGGPRGPGRMMQMSPEDRAAANDARIAAFKAMLRLTPEQERHWPALETALREAATQRSQRAAERMQRWREARENRDNRENREAARPDPVQRMRAAADRMAENAAAMRKLADAAGPLYASLDDGQKRRVDRMMHRGGRGMGMGMGMDMGRGGWGGRGWGWEDGDRRGPRWERDQDGPRRGPRGEGGRL